ncbi:MAG: tetratricopeptide repeat protein [Thermoanaerobaculia bacterium]|nr:MAG: tetratricopeptide repeat protein [Thermoanaerobaculia bacterium]
MTRQRDDGTDEPPGRQPETTPATRTESGPSDWLPGDGHELRRGDSLGRYLILGRLGAGGMGVVYTAFDPELDRKVAVKLLHGDRARRGSARLQREARALARLQHPNVIAVHDVGTIDGRVFVAMEYVDGETLTAHLDRVAPDWRVTLALFEQAGRGLAAAHAAGLVHRDFKPENVLVGRDGRVRVLDFGLARATSEGGDGEGDGMSGPLTDSRADLLATPLTRAGTVVGTPAYMAPEQLDGTPADARSDQFGFAVALWEGLYRRPPFAGEQRRHVRVPRRRRRLRLTGGGAAVAVALAAVGGSLWRDARLCRGAERRFTGVWDATVRQEIERAFLASGFPFAESSWKATERALDGWRSAWTSGWSEACEATHGRGEQSAALLDLRMGCLDARLENFEAFAALLPAADAALVERAPQAVAALPGVAACADREALLSRVPPPEGEAAMRRVEATRRAVAGVRALRLAGKFAAGEEAAARLAPAVDFESYRPLRAEFLLERADLATRLGDLAAAEAHVERSVREALAGRDPVLAAEAAGAATHIVGVRGARHAEGRRWADLGFALLEGAGGDERVEAIVRGHLGNLLNATGDRRGAAAELEKALALQERALGAEAPEVGRTLNNLGNAYYLSGDLTRALPTYQRSLAVKEATVGREHPDLTSSLNNLALVLSDLERFDEALAHLERALGLLERVFGPDHPSVALELGNLAAIHIDLGRHAEALLEARRALEISRRGLGEQHPDLAYPINNIGNALLGLGRLEEAQAAFRQAIALREAAFGRGHPELAFPLVGLGRAMLEAGRPEAALAPLRRALEIREREQVDAPQLAEARFHLGRALGASGGSRGEAERLVRTAREGLIAAGGRPARLLAEVEAWLNASR